MSARSYLDWNASAPLRAEARNAMIAAMDVVGNPSSVHGEGRATKALVEQARGTIAEAIGCKPREICFTSGATEAAGILANWPGPVSVSPEAHDALLTHDRPDGDGQQLRAFGLVNSETGVVSKEQASPHTATLIDLTQALGRIPVAFGWTNADFGIVAAHKLGGPKGIGVLIVREGVEIPAIQKGGGQEMGRRAGTENVLGIVGFAAAVTAAQAELSDGTWARVDALRAEFEQMIAEQNPEAIIVGSDQKRLPNTTCLIAPGWRGETQVIQMDLAGFAVSAGSACSSGKVKASRVLKHLGYDDEMARCAIRVSIGPTTTQDELTSFAAAWTAGWTRHRARAA